MAIGERIRFFRNLKGMTQKFLGVQVGFPEKTADIRMAQYESGSRCPKADLINALAQRLGVSTQALSVPDIDSHLGLMHTLFTLEDIYGFKIDKDTSGEVCIRLENSNVADNRSIHKYFAAWQKQAEKYRSGEISKEEYDCWRYNYPKFDTESGWVKVPSQELSDAMVEAFKDHLKDK